jgi:hypothetical protein
LLLVLLTLVELLILIVFIVSFHTLLLYEVKYLSTFYHYSIIQLSKYYVAFKSNTTGAACGAAIVYPPGHLSSPPILVRFVFLDL